MSFVFNSTLVDNINNELSNGWLVKCMVSELTTTSLSLGKICVIFEREIPRDDTGPK